MNGQTSGLKVIGYILMILGLIAVVLARGADTLDARNVTRLEAAQKKAQADFKREWDDKLAAAKDADKAGLEKQETDKAAELTKGDWKTLAGNIDDAKSQNDRFGYFYQLGFLGGSVLLILGLLLVGIKGQGAERIISLIIIAIIAYSLYVGGAAWGSAALRLMPGT